MSQHNPASSPVSCSPWRWVPSLYFAQAVPNVMVVTVSVFAYTRLGVSAVVIGYTAWLSLPWMFKPLWSPIVELYATERQWTWMMQYLAALALAVVGIGYRSEHFMLWTVVGYGLLALASATHDIAADGYYMRVLNSHDQTWFAGLRNVFFRVGVIFGEGLLLAIAGRLMARQFDVGAAWALTHFLAALLLFLLATYHLFALPGLPPKAIPSDRSLVGTLGSTLRIFRQFFSAIPLAVALPFLLLFRFAEAQLAKFVGKFLIDPREVGGLGLLEEQVGWINGVGGVIALLAGGVLGGVVAARFGLRRCLFAMALLLNVPNLVYVALAYYQPDKIGVIGLGIIVEKFGYGFGFTGYMLYLLYIAQGEYRTSFYAIGTGFMTLGLIFPQSIAGYLLESWGYEHFFLWVMAATVPSFIVTLMALPSIDPSFGLKNVSS